MTRTRRLRARRRFASGSPTWPAPTTTWSSGAFVTWTSLSELDHGDCTSACHRAKLPVMPAETQNAFSWDDVRVFLVLCRARTLTAAGARLGVNASTVGRRLAALESAVGARLFDRTPDGVLPTHAAEQLLAHAERVEDAANGLAGAVSGFEA